MENLPKLIEAAQTILPYALGISVFGYLCVWLSPIFSENQHIRVVDRANSLSSDITQYEYLEKEKGRKWGLIDKMHNKVNIFNLMVMNITRGAFIHKFFHNNRINKFQKRT
jgi:hypothetical protein